MSSRADLESDRQSSPASDHPTWPDIEEAQAVLEAMAQIFTRETRVVGPQLNPAGTVRAPVAPPSLVGLATVDRRGTLRSLSPQAAALFGCDARDAIGQSVSLIFSDDAPIVVAAFAQNGSSPSSSDLRGKRRDGTTFPLGYSMTSIDIPGEPLVALALWDRSSDDAADAERRQAEARYRSLIEQIPAVTFMGSLSGDVIELYVSPQIEALLGFSQEEWLGDPFLWFNQLHPDDREPCNREFARGCRTGGPFRAEFRAFTRDGRVVWIRGEARMIRDENGRPTFIQGIAYDITDSKRAEEAVRAHAEQMKISLAEKEVLLKEIHHRVKNNLQVISSLLKLQSSHVQDKSALDMFNESQNRVHAMALVHEKLYQSRNLSQIDLGEYVASLTGLLQGSYRTRLDPVAVTSDIGKAFVGIDIAVPLGMIINELVSNSLKYAFPSGRGGHIHLQLRDGSAGQRVLCVRDDGVGFPQDVDFRETTTFGMQLVCALTEQIGGSIEMVATGDGTEFRISFRE